MKFDIAFLGLGGEGDIVKDMFQYGLEKHSEINSADFEVCTSRFGEGVKFPKGYDYIIENIKLKTEKAYRSVGGRSPPAGCY